MRGDPLFAAEHWQALLAIKRQTHCLFARQSHIWSSRPWRAEIPFEDNVRASIPAFALFAAAQKRIDGFAWDVAFAGAGQSVDSHAATVNQLLRTLRYDRAAHCDVRQPIPSDLDPSGRRCMNVSYLGRRGWVFSFADEEMFVTTFAGCYDQTNARFGYGMQDRCIVLFQVAPCRH